MGGSAVKVREKKDWRKWWNDWEGLSSGTIKIIAVIAMVIDHFGAGVLGRYLSQAGIFEAVNSGDAGVWNTWMAQNAGLYQGYYIMRGIGRLSFPIYCYFLVEGLKYTRSAVKYLGRLLLFAVLSEIPFDLLFNGSVLEFGSQNVYFTLAIGLAVMMGMKKVDEKMPQQLMGSLLQLLIFAAGCIFAVVFSTDYEYLGILCITVIYLFSQSRRRQLIAGAVIFWWEFPMAPLSFLLLALYKKKRGAKLKYFFYAFYPVHLFLLYLLTLWLGIWNQVSM